MDIKQTDVIIIGAGIAGTAIARELSQYEIDVILMEKEADVSFGSTKASTAIIHPGLPVADAPLKTKLILDGNRLFKQLANELDVTFKKTGELTIAKNENELQELKEMKRQADAIKIPEVEVINRKKLQSMEPNITKEAIAALSIPTAGIALPFEITIALAENASQNGVRILLNTEVTDISRGADNQSLLVKTACGYIKTRFVINAAGLFADQIAAMLNADDFSISPHKGEEYLLDKRVGSIVNQPILTVASPWVLVMPTVDGNIILGTTYTEVNNKADSATTLDGFRKIINDAKDLIPIISPKDIIRSFAGLRAMNTHTSDYIIEASKKEPKLINVVLGSPGITSAPAVAKMVVEILSDQGLKLAKKPNFNPQREKMLKFSELSDEERKALIAKDPRYGHVVCRCETVTEGEIVEAIRRGARTVDGVKYRTRAGMGRCQGGFCGPRVIEILARELNIPVTEITKKGKNSQSLLFKSKELLKKGGKDNKGSSKS